MIEGPYGVGERCFMADNMISRRSRDGGTMRSLFTLDVIAIVLVIIGAVAWGLIGLFQWNVVHAIFSAVPWLERVIYITMGAAGVYTAIVTPVWLKLHRPARSATTRVV